MNRNFSNLKMLRLKRQLDLFVKKNSDNMSVCSVCESFSDKIKNGVNEAVICNDVINELSRVANDKASKSLVKTLKESVSQNARNISIVKNVISIENGPMSYIAPALESAAFDYLTNKNAETRESFKSELGMFGKSTETSAINENLMYDDLDERSGKKLSNVAVLESEKVEKLYTESEVNAMLESSKVSEPEKEPEVKNFRMIESHIELDKTIKKILKNAGRNEKLKVFCEQYENALNVGTSEEQLYESFISGASNWNYLNAVDTEMSALRDRVSKYKLDIDLKKILETMSQTSSYYIVPLIEDCVVDYVNNKNAQTRAILRDRLYSFEHDPFVRDIVNIITCDCGINNTVNLGGDVELANKYINTEKIYSPVMAVKEGECVFNVKGIFYSKTNNTIKKLSKSSVSSLNESFVNLCNTINSNNVNVNGDLNTITVYGDNNTAVITESEVRINDAKVTAGELKNLMEQSSVIFNGSNDFYKTVYTINENFNNIAYIDFGKRISSRDNSGHSVDVFRLNNNIFVTTVNENFNSSTFYSNVNPIQCRNYINDYMGINAAPMFEDIMPEQENTETEIDETKKGFESYINNLETKRETLEGLKNEADGDTEEIDAAIELIDKELDSVKNDYKKYQDDSDKFINGDDDSAEGDDKEVRDDIMTSGEDDPEMGNGDDIDDDGEKEFGKETETDMETPVTADTAPIEYTSDDSDDFDSSDIPEYDDVLDTTETDSEGFKIVRVSYSRNMKTDTTENKGEVIYIESSVDSNGYRHDDMKKVTFTLDDNRNPIINNEYMPLDLYCAIKDAIIESPETSNIDVDSTSDFSNDDEISDFDSDDLEIGTLLKEPDDSDDDDDDDDESVERESPAETADNKLPSYPINVDLDVDDIKPIKECDFEKALDEMHIAHTKCECDGNNVICLVIGNKAKAHALKDYFAEWNNFDDDDFKSFFPELSPCFNVPVTEGVAIKGVKTLYEHSVLPKKLVVKCNSDYVKLFGLKESMKDTFVEMIFINESERYCAYKKLREFSKKHRIDEDARGFISALDIRYSRIFESEHNHMVRLPYSNIVEQKLSLYNIESSINEDNIDVIVNDENLKSVNKAIKNIYDGKSVKISLNEGVRITIKDDRTGKTVEIDTDEINTDDNIINEPSDFESSFKDTTDLTTMNIENSLAFKDTEDSSDEENDDEKKKNESEDENVDIDNSTNEDEDENDDEEEKESSDENKPKEGKKKVVLKKFKVKKKNESVYAKKTKRNALNEALVPGVMDYVQCKDGLKGQIIGKPSADSFIVSIGGHTRLCNENDFTVTTNRDDIVECPHKFDERTLKGLFEQMVECGLFMHNNRLTGNDCYVKLSEYMKAKDTDTINIMLEGKTTPVTKKYIQITEDIDNATDISNYFKAGLVNESGYVRDVLVNGSDYQDYLNRGIPTISVRALVSDKNGDTHMEHVAASSICKK